MRFLRRFGLAVALTMSAVVVVAGPAYAAAEAVTPKDDTVITIPLALATAIAGILIPIVHGIITKLGAAPIVRVLVGLTLSAVAGLINTAVVLDGVAVFSKTAVVAAALAWVTQMATSLGIWKPLDTPQKLAPDKGLG